MTGDEEWKIALSFSSSDARDDPDNHCVPILDHFADDENPRISYIVMPFLRLMDDPPFLFVDDVVDMADQLLQVSALQLCMRLPSLYPKGLVYMHRYDVAHR